MKMAAHKKQRWGKERQLLAPVVGVHYRVTHADVARIAERLPLKVNLTREPENSFDVNAVRVELAEYLQDFHIGYLPRDIAAILAPQMDEGEIWLEACILTELEEGSGQLAISFHKKLRNHP